jgi:hypothetical protein
MNRNTHIKAFHILDGAQTFEGGFRSLIRRWLTEGYAERTQHAIGGHIASEEIRDGKRPWKPDEWPEGE